MSLNFTIQTNARLHLGIFSDPRPEGRRFQGLGLMIDEPSFRLNFRSNIDGQLNFTGSPTWIETGEKLISGFNFAEQPALHIQIQGEIPAHQGLGSGTQFAYALCYGLLKAQGTPEITVEHLRKLTGRGQRSSIGSQGFLQGGFWLDSGHDSEQIDHILATRLEFPSDWRIVLFQPLREQGLSGKKEQEAFARWPEFNHQEVDELLRLSQQIIPEAITKQDFTKFSKSIVEYGCIVGQSFSLFQGGIYSATYGNWLDQKIRDLGHAGVVQSSWGPTLCLFLENHTEAQAVVHTLNGMQAELPFDMKIVRAAYQGTKFF